MLNMFKEINATDVYTVKLISKEELVGRITEVTEQEIKIRKPLCLVSSGNNMGFIPWVITGSGLEVYLQVPHVLTVDRASTEISNSYIQSTTGLKL